MAWPKWWRWLRDHLTMARRRRSLALGNAMAPRVARFALEAANLGDADMRSLPIALLVAGALTSVSPAWAGPAEDATTAVTNVLDKFNAGDFKAFAEAHRDGALIIDEFPPYQWRGTGSIKQWGADYEKDAAARGITAGRIDYGKPLQAHSDGTSAYIVLPTTYRFQEKGAKMAGTGSMTFVMNRADTGWKIASWTYAGATPAAEK